jgi:hypothetical protein
LPLPLNPYEIAEWKTAVVAFNYHIGVDEQYYSVPHEDNIAACGDFLRGYAGGIRGG